MTSNLNNTDISSQDNSDKKTNLLLACSIFLIILGSVYMYQVYNLNKVKNAEKLAADKALEMSPEERARVKKIGEISASLTVQDQTPQFKDQIEQISQSLNKK